MEEKKEKQGFFKKLFSGRLSKINLKRKSKKPKENAYNNAPVNIMLTVQDDDDNDDKLATLNKETPPGIEFKFDKQARSAEDDVFDELNGSAHKEAFRFKPNSTYTTILLYAIFFIVVAALVVIGIAKGSFSGALRYFLSAVSPFIVALFVGDQYEDDGDIITVAADKGEVDVTWNLYEIIALAIPIYHVHPDGECRDDINALFQDDALQETPTDARWDALRSLLDKTKE